VNTNQRPTTGNYPSSKTARPRYRTGALKEENQRFHQVKQNQNTLDTAGVVRDDPLPRSQFFLTFAFYSPIVRAVEETGNGWRAGSIAD